MRTSIYSIIKQFAKDIICPQFHCVGPAVEKDDLFYCKFV